MFLAFLEQAKHSELFVFFPQWQRGFTEEDTSSLLEESRGWMQRADSILDYCGDGEIIRPQNMKL